MSEITYHGPGSAYRVPHFEGEQYVFPRNVPTEAPAALAAELAEREDFTYSDQAPPEPEIAAAEEAPDEVDAADEIPEDPDGVNADHPYGEE